MNKMLHRLLLVTGMICASSTSYAADLQAAPYGSAPVYEREMHTYEYKREPQVIVAEPAPAETVIVRRPVLPRTVVVEEETVYADPRIYPAPRVFAYAGPGWRAGWRHRHYPPGW